MTTGNKKMWKRGEIPPQEQFLLFSTLYISNFRSQITYSFVKCDCSIYCFPHSLNSDMSRYGYLEVFQRVPWNSRSRDSTVLFAAMCCICIGEVRNRKSVKYIDKSRNYNHSHILTILSMFTKRNNF